MEYLLDDALTAFHLPARRDVRQGAYPGKQVASRPVHWYRLNLAVHALAVLTCDWKVEAERAGLLLLRPFQFQVP
ncbi:hypothetical protein [Deinococcus indicus]|uniref:hypothetical protein n=1 Tax=Deinococcus indicus TaxID=223556 RepID=UPI0015559610|nr:hypothetical protein [Deinococcus indicus]